VAPAAFRALVSNTPFINLFYTRLALDYLILWHIQEWLNPGAMRRFEQSVERNHRQRFWLSPSAAVGGSRPPPRRRREPQPEPRSWAR
jgi:hypothetical protein